MWGNPVQVKELKAHQVRRIMTAWYFTFVSPTTVHTKAFSAHVFLNFISTSIAALYALSAKRVCCRIGPETDAPFEYKNTEPQLESSNLDPSSKTPSEESSENSCICSTFISRATLTKRDCIILRCSTFVV